LEGLEGVLSMEHGHRGVTERVNLLTLSLTASHGASWRSPDDAWTHLRL